MTTALTVTEQATEQVDLPMSIVHATAKVAEIQDFCAKNPLSVLTKCQQHMIRYAYARAVYREELDLTVEQVATLACTSIEKVLAYATKLKIQVRDMMSNTDASRIMCNMMEM